MSNKKTSLYDYLNFVDSVTSDFSKNHDKLLESLEKLKNKLNVPRLLTASLGLSGETGELVDLVKKLVFHGKELTEKNRDELIKELGDILWYWANACMALNLDPYDVLEKNIDKLKSRYPEGFSVERSENRTD